MPADSRAADQRILAAALCVLFACIVIKAASADMTWDEAWTYLFYGRTPLGFLRLDYANDHPLNSILVWAATRAFGNAELVIRLPNVLAGGVYLLATARLLRAVRLKLLAAAICLLQPALFDYFALARGYGIAAALLQVGLVAGVFAPDVPAPGGRRRSLVLLACCLLASLTISATVVVLYAAIASHLALSLRARLRDGAPIAGLVPSALFAVLGLVPVAALLWVSREGLPLYGGRSGFFDAIPRSLAGMYAAEAWATPVAVLGLLAVAALLVASRRRFAARTGTLLLTCLFALAAIWLSARVLHKPLPTGRVLVPFVPLFNLTLIAMAEDIGAGLSGPRRRLASAASLAVAVVLAAVFLQRLHFQRYADWPEDAGLQARLVRALAHGGCLPPDVWDRYGHVYYLDRWFGAAHMPPDIRCQP